MQTLSADFIEMNVRKISTNGGESIDSFSIRRAVFSLAILFSAMLSFSRPLLPEEILGFFWVLFIVTIATKH